MENTKKSGKGISTRKSLPKKENSAKLNRLKSHDGLDIENPQMEKPKSSLIKRPTSAKHT